VRNCEGFLDRLFEEDVRRALVERKPLPCEVERHAAECAECAAALVDFTAESKAVLEALIETVPDRLAATTRAAFARAFPARSVTLIDWAPAGVWALAGGAAAVCLLILTGVGLPWTWQVFAFAAAGAAALSTEITRQALETSGC
jgi:hypothetical protein